MTPNFRIRDAQQTGRNGAVSRQAALRCLTTGTGQSPSGPKVDFSGRRRMPRPTFSDQNVQEIMSSVIRVADAGR
jgi:hypothetical protein